MTRTASPKSALKRGALITAANWQVVVIHFIADAVFTALLAVPVVGGAALVVLTSGLAPQDLFGRGIRRAVPALAAALLAHPVALVAFLFAVVLVVLGGSLVMAFVKGGTLTVLVAAERDAGPIEQPPLRPEALAATGRFTLERATDGAHAAFGRFAWLGVWLVLAYAAVTGAGAVALVGGGTPDSAWDAARIAGLTLVAGAAVTVVNLLYLLTQIAIVADDTDVNTAIGRMFALVLGHRRQIGAVFGIVLALFVLGTAASVLATAALGLIAFVPFIGLAALPLQVAAWAMRGLVFQYVGLTATVAYLHLYRQARAPTSAESPPGAQAAAH